MHNSSDSLRRLDDDQSGGASAAAATATTTATSPKELSIQRHNKLSRELLEKIAEYDDDGVKAILEEVKSYDFDLNFMNGNGASPLIAAIHSEQREIVKLLLEAGADPNFCTESWNRKKYIPLLEATKLNMSDSVDKLLNHGADIKKKDINKCDALMIAVCKGYKVIVRSILNKTSEYGAMKDRNSDDESALDIATLHQDTTILVMLLDRAPDLVNEKNKDGYTALYYACSNDNVNAVRKLLNSSEFKKDPNKKSMLEVLPWAAKNGYKDVVEIIINYGIDVNTVDDDGKMPLHHAVENGHIDIIYALTDQKYRPSQNNLDKALILATKLAPQNPLLIRAIDALILRGANPNVNGEDHKSAIDLAYNDPATTASIFGAMEKKVALSRFVQAGSLTQQSSPLAGVYIPAVVGGANVISNASLGQGGSSAADNLGAQR